MKKLFCLLALVSSCGGGSESSPDPTAGPVADFFLTDVNPNSASSGESRSPRQYLNWVSAWYFGHAT